MLERPIKTIVRDDGERQIHLYERDDGFFTFIEEERVLTYDGEAAWAPIVFGPICETIEIAEREARSGTEWVGASRVRD